MLELLAESAQVGGRIIFMARESDVIEHVIVTALQKYIEEEFLWVGGS